MNLQQKVKAYHFYIDYLRSHEALKEIGVVKRDRKMISWEEAETRWQAFETVCCRLLRGAIMHHFSGWPIKKPRNVAGYVIGQDQQERTRYDYQLRRYVVINPTDEAAEWSKFYNILIEDTNGNLRRGAAGSEINWKHTEIREQMTRLQTRAAEAPFGATLDWGGYRGQIGFTLNSNTCGLHRLITLLPEVKEVVSQAMTIAENREAWEEEQARRKEARRRAFTRFDYGTFAV